MSQLKTDPLFNMIRNYFAAGDGAHLPAKVNGIFQIDITEKKGGKPVKSWIIDVKNGNGSCSEGAGKHDALFTLTDDDFLQIVSGDLNPQKAFIQVS